MYHNLPRIAFLITYLENQVWAKLIVSGRETTNQLQAPLADVACAVSLRKREIVKILENHPRKCFKLDDYRHGVEGHA